MEEVRIQKGNISLRFGGSDTPAPNGVVNIIPRIAVAVSPPDPRTKVAVVLRFGEKENTFNLRGSSKSKDEQLFEGSFPSMREGDKLQYYVKVQVQSLEGIIEFDSQDVKGGLREIEFRKERVSRIPPTESRIISKPQPNPTPVNEEIKPTDFRASPSAEALTPTENPLMANTVLKYNASKLSEVLNIASLGVDNDIPMLLRSSNDQKAFLLKQWQVEKSWSDGDVAKIGDALSLMRVVGSQADVVTALWNDGVQKTTDLASYNVASLKTLMRKAKVGSPEATENDAFAKAVLLQAEQEHPSAFFMNRVAENPEWLGLAAADRPKVSNDFKNFYAQNKTFDLQNEPILSLETGLLNQKIVGAAASPDLISELNAAQQALQISPDTDIAALLLAKKVNVYKANTATHKGLMRELDIDAATAVQIKQKAQSLHDATMNGYLAYRDIYSNPFLKNVLGNLAPVKDSIEEGIGKNDNWEAAKLANGLRALDTIEDLFGSQNYCECDSCQSVLSPSAYFVDLMRFIEDRVLESTVETATLTITEKLLDEANPIHLKVRRPDLWTLRLTCENTNKRIPYIEIINEVLSAFIQQHLGTGKTIGERLLEEKPTLEFSSPYNQSLDELRTWLSFFQLLRLQVLEYLYPIPGDTEKLAIAIERLNLSKELYDIIIDDTFAATIDTDVLAFRRKSGLDDHETEQLVALKFWNNELKIKQVKDIGDIQKFSLEFETAIAGWQGQMHRLIRLWKATGWSLGELDSIFQLFAITKDTLDEAAILNLALYKQLQVLIGFDVETLSGVLVGVPATKSGNSKLSWEQVLPKTWVVDSSAKLTDLIANTEDNAVKLLLDLQGVFGVDALDIVACLTLLKEKIGTGNPLTITFNTATLNTVFKYIHLYKWTKADSFEAFAQLLTIWGKGATRYFDTPLQDIPAFANYLQSLPLRIGDLLYLFGEEVITTKVIEEDKEALLSAEIREFIKQDPFKSPERFTLFFNKWMGIDQEVLGYFKNFLEVSDADLDNLFDDFIIDIPVDATYISLSNIKNRLERLVFLFDKYKIDLDSLKKMAQDAKDCIYLQFGFTTWKNQVWVKEIGYLGHWVADTRGLRNFDLFKVLRNVEKEASLSETEQKAIAKWQKITLVQIQNTLKQSNSISELQALWEQFLWAKRLNINSELLDKLKIDVALGTQSELLQNAIRSKFDDNEIWEISLQEYKNKLSSNLRDALCNFVIFNKDLRATDFGFSDRESLYQYFLLDVNMGDCFTLPRTVAATNSLQVYVHRCIMGLERSADEKTSILLDIDEIQEWEWRKNYRVWEANRKIFLFPENYAEPEIRDNKSPEFKELEDELLQQKLNMEVVENAYKKYLEQIMILAELRMAGAYFDKAYNRIYLFGKTNKQPVEFYYRYLEFLESGGVIWSNWEKMNISIPAEDLSAIRYNGKLHVFWTTYQRKDISKTEGGTSTIEMHTYDFFVNYSYLKVDKKWSAPQRIEMGYRTNSPFDPFLRVARYNDKVTGSNTSNPQLKQEAYPIRENVLKEFEQTVYRKPYPVWAFDQNFLNLKYIWTDKKDALEPRYKYSRALIDAFKVPVKLVVKVIGFSNLTVEMNFEFSFNRFDEVIQVATSRSQTQAPFAIDIATRGYAISMGGEQLRFQLTFSKDNQGTYHYSFLTRDSGANKMFFFKEKNTELKSGDVDIHHQIDYVPVSNIDYTTLTVDMARQKKVPKGFSFGAMTVTPGLIATETNRRSVSIWNTATIMGMVTSPNFGGLIVGGIIPVRGNSLESEYDTYYDNFNNFFVTDGSNGFADGNNDYKIQQRDMVSVLTTPTNADPNKGYKLNPEQIQMLWDKISTGIDTLMDTQTTQRHVAGQMDYSQSFGNYFYELFFHIPMRIADHLNTAGKYREANHWYSYIYNPTAIKDKFEQLAFPNDVNWRFAAFRNVALEKLKDIYKNPNAIEMYRRNPGNPHAIARLRIGAYQKNVVMKYLDNLMDWADNLFQQYTPESTSEARHLYSVVKTILGNKPQQTGKCSEPKELTYSQIGNAAGNEFIYNLFAPQQAVVEDKQQTSTPAKISTDVSGPLMARLSNSSIGIAKYGSKMMGLTTLGMEKVATKANDLNFSMASSKMADSAFRIDRPIAVTAPSVGSRLGTYKPNFDFLKPTRPLPYFNPEIDLAFCFPHNKDFIQYWDRVDDRIYKLNHCLDINGVKKLMPAYAPEIDPALLARMVAGGLSFDEIAAALNSRLPNHRFVYLIEKSKQFTGVVQSFGQALFAAIEKKDGEELTLLRSRHEQNILALTTRNKKQQIEQAKTSLQTLLENQKNIEIRKSHYEGLIEEGLTTWETVQQVSKHVGTGLKLAESVVHLMAGITYLIPQVGSPFAMKYGGQELGHSGVEFAQWASSMASIADAVSASAGLEAGNQRREQEWQFQLTTAKQELVSVSQQVRNGEIALKLAELDFELHQTSIEQYKELYEFYTTKFTDYKHYTFQVRQLQQLYRMAFNLAHDMAAQAQQAFDFERYGVAVSSGFIKNDNWNNEKLGLLAGERLMLQLMQLEKEFIDSDKRRKEITQHFSMLQLAPDKLLALKTEGECQDFSIPEAAFDLMYPGYYRRIIKSVRMSIPCIAGPYTNIGTTLTLGVNKIRTKTDEGLSDFNFTGCEAIATSSAQNDGGQFDLNFRDERYLPFEGAGAVSSWTLSLPNVVRPFDYNTISDVIFHISYSAEYDGVFKDGVESNLKAALNNISGPGKGMNRVFSLRHDFPNEWHKLSDATTAADVVLELRREHFPYFAHVDAIKSIGAKVFSLDQENVLTEEADNLGITKTAKLKVTIPAAIAARNLRDLIFFVNYTCA